MNETSINRPDLSFRGLPLPEESAFGGRSFSPDISLLPGKGALAPEEMFLYAHQLNGFWSSGNAAAIAALTRIFNSSRRSNVYADASIGSRNSTVITPG